MKRDGELTTPEAAKYCGYAYRSFQRLYKKIPRRKERGSLYFTKAALDEFIASQSVDHVPTKGAA